MSDDDIDGTDAAPDDPGADARDDRLAAALAVEPLDEVTKRRLVRNALDATAAKPSRPLLAAAVSVAALLLAGVVAVGITLASNGDDRPTAAPRPERVHTADRATTTTSQTSEKTAGAPVPAATSTGVPDFGDISDLTTLQARVRAVTNGADTEQGLPTTVTDRGPVPCVTRLGKLGLDDLRVVGTGIDHDRRVTVLVGDDHGTAIAVSVLPGTCVVRAETFV